MEEAHNLQNTESPRVCVDAIIDMGAGQVLLIERKHEPKGWALPGGFVEVGESLEAAVLREIKEETGLQVELVRQFHTYSDPKRDPRGATISTVFIARGHGEPLKSTDETSASGLFHQMNLPADMPFDHRQILTDYFVERY